MLLRSFPRMLRSNLERHNDGAEKPNFAPTFLLPGDRLGDLFINLNMHFRRCFAQACSWLNVAELEVGILDRQCQGRRLPDCSTLTAEVDAWQQRRNA